MSKVDDLKDSVTKSINEMFISVIKFALNTKTNGEGIEKLKKKYKGVPQDALADLLIKRAVRKNTIEGAINGAFITGTEIVALLPIPDPTSKAIAISATGLAII